MKNEVESKIGHIILHKGTPQLRAETHSTGQFPHIWPSKCKVEALSAGTPPKWADWQILLRSYTWTGSLKLAQLIVQEKRLIMMIRDRHKRLLMIGPVLFASTTISRDVPSAILRLFPPVLKY